MAQHTPGPWKWCGNYLMQDVGGETNPFATPVRRPIADDGSAGGEYAPTIDVNGPDARLIAASPDLLAALTKVEAAYDRAPNGIAFSNIVSELMPEISAALAKARP